MKYRSTGIAFVAVLFLFLTINPLLFQSFWENEGKYIWAARHSVHDILLYNAKDQSPAYFLLLHFWMKLFGQSEFVLRLPSLLFGLFSIFFLYRIGVLLGSLELGLLSALFLSVSTLVIGMSQEVKHWTLFLLLSLLTLYFVLLYLKEWRRKHLMAFLLVGFVNAYVCFYSLANLFAVFAWLICLGLEEGFRKGELSSEFQAKSKEVLVSFLILGIAILPQFLRISQAANFVNWQGAQWGVPKTFPGFFLIAAKDLIGFSYRGALDGIWLALGLVFFIRGVIRTDWRVALLAFFWIAPPLFVGYEMAGKASIRERYFIALIPVCLFLIATGVLSLKGNRLRRLFAILLVGLAIPSLWKYYASHRHDNRNFMNEDWRGATRYIQKRFQDGDFVNLNPGRVIEGFLTYSDLPVLYGRALPLDYFLNYRRLWVISVYGDLPKDSLYPVIDSVQFSNIWVTLYDLHPLGDYSPEAPMGVYDFREHLKDAHVAAHFYSGRTLRYTDWRHDARYLGYTGEVGSWGEGLMTERWDPTKNFGFPEDLWKTVSKTRQKSGWKLRPVIWVHPVEGGVVEVRYPRVPMNQWLKGFYGFTGYSVTQGKAPVSFAIRIGDERVFQTVKANQPGWKDFQIPTEKWQGTEQTVTFEVSAGHIRWRHFCFNAWVDNENASSVKLRFAGDTMFARGVADKIEKNKDPFFSFQKIAPWLQEADVAFANLETSISNLGQIVPQKEFYFRSDPKFAPVLKQAGLDVLSLANNHILDYGPQAALDTIRHLKKDGMASIGLDWTPRPQPQEAKIVTRHGIRIAFLGYSFIATQFQNLWPQPFPLDVTQLQTDIREAIRRAELVVVSAHWGREYDYKFDENQRQFAHAAIDAGAHIVVGAHPHVVQEVERYRHGVIFYSLGDFVFDMPADWRRVKSWPALAAEVEANSKGQIKHIQLVPIWINEHYQPEQKNVFDIQSLWVTGERSPTTSHSFSNSLKNASLQWTREGKNEPCKEWRTDRMGGSIFFRDRWSCGGRADFGVTQIRERSGGIFRDGLLATLERDTEFQLEYTEVPSGEKLEGFYGWPDFVLSEKGRRSMLVEILIDGRKAWSDQLQNKTGWQHFEIPLQEGPRASHRVVWRFKNSGDPSPFVFDGRISTQTQVPSFRLVKVLSHLEDPDILWPKSVRISPDGRQAYLQNLDGRNTMIFDTQTLQKLKTLRHEGKPVETTFTQNGRYAWITYLALIGEKYPPYHLEWTPQKGWDTEYRFPSVVIVYDTQKGEVVHKIPVSIRPKFLAATPDERYVLVSNWSSDSISVIDARHFKLLKEIKVEISPRGINFSKDGRLAYVANMRASSLAVIDLEKLAVVRWIKEGIIEGPRHLVRNRSGDRLYISANWSGQIQVMDLDREKIIQNIKVGQLPRSIVLSPDENWLYVDNYGSGTVSIVNLKQGKEASTLKVAEEPVGIDVTPDGRYLWVTCYRSHQIMIFERTALD